MNGHQLLAAKVIVITAAAGIGSAAARRCLEEGARG
jgi:3-oxoacyl-[acyl-carrier protein] reductase